MCSKPLDGIKEELSKFIFVFFVTQQGRKWFRLGGEKRGVNALQLDSGWQRQTGLGRKEQIIGGGKVRKSRHSIRDLHCWNGDR
jgi:hypothetical protein